MSYELYRKKLGRLLKKKQKFEIQLNNLLSEKTFKKRSLARISKKINNLNDNIYVCRVWIKYFYFKKKHKL